MSVARIQTSSRSSKLVSARSKTKKTPTDKINSDMQLRIQVAAYYKAQARGFMPGHELEDWLTAEKEEIQ